MDINFNIGAKVASDDHCAVGIITEIDGELFVVGDFGKVEFETYHADWQPFEQWKAKVDSDRKSNRGTFMRLWNYLKK